MPEKAVRQQLAQAPALRELDDKRVRANEFSRPVLTCIFLHPERSPGDGEVRAPPPDQFARGSHVSNRTR